MLILLSVSPFHFEIRHRILILDKSLHVILIFFNISLAVYELFGYNRRKKQLLVTKVIIMKSFFEIFLNGTAAHEKMCGIL